MMLQSVGQWSFTQCIALQCNGDGRGADDDDYGNLSVIHPMGPTMRLE